MRTAPHLLTAAVLLAHAGLLGLTACDDDKPGTDEFEAPGGALEDTAAAPPAAPAPATYLFTTQQAGRFAALSLKCGNQPYPNKPGHVLHADDDLKPPRELTPAFFGCFDWHSAVHGHWTLVRLLKKFPKLPRAQAARELLARHLTEDNIARELAFFQLKRSKLFERPYGWGWLLRLAAELHTWDAPAIAGPLSSNLEELDTFLAQRTVDYLDRLSVPVRAGTHQNTAFSLVHMLDYARAVEETALEQAILRRARDFYFADRACPTAYEPSGEDFISPCLTEADLMRRVLPATEFVTWLDGFLPAVDAPEFAPLRTPVQVKDRKDPRIGHLIGLALQRAWCFEGIATALPAGDTRVNRFRALAAVHRDEGLKEMFDSGYGGAHWLASFAVYLLTGAGPY